MLGVKGVLQLGQGLRVVLDAEVDNALAVAPEVSDQRVIGVEGEPGPPGARLDRPRPFVGERLHLAVAIELIAEEIAEDDQRGAELPGYPWQPGLVDLEEPFAALLLQECRGDSPGHI